ncbi:MAG: response regulator [Magnetococcales bacterium]|nr:response regulator [Magnetococcales bacterium]
MAIDLKKFIGRFVEEARDHIRQIHQGLESMNGEDSAQVHAIFRSAHTIKGSSRMLKLTPITEIAHRVEEVMDGLRNSTLTLSAERITGLQTAIDAIAALVDRLAETPDGTLLPQADPTLLEELQQLAIPTPVTSAPPVAPAVATTRPVRTTPDDGLAAPRLKTEDTIRVRLEKLDELTKLMGELLSGHAHLRQRTMELNTLEHRISALLLDHPLAMQLHHFSRTLREDVLDQESLMVALHDKTLLMRMLPLSLILEPAERLARGLARSIGKQAICHIQGAGIELDRRIIDKLSDPIIHLIRNAIDHGLELPEERTAVGKLPQGTLTLSARQDGGWVVIEVADDGKGIGLEAVRSKAVRMGLVPPDKAHTLGELETLELIFLPGFSTSTFVTDMSGRGVGMDVVRQTISNDLRGTVTVATRPGSGTTFTLRLPLSLAMMRVLMVETAGVTFGFTSQYVAEMLRVPASARMTLAEREVIVVRNEFIPLLPLATLLELPSHDFASDADVHFPNRQTSGILAVILTSVHNKIAIIVDALLDEHDMVIHPLPPLLRKLPLVSGLVVTGNHELVSILHVPELFERARHLRAGTRTAGTTTQLPPDRVLVVDDSLNTREIEKELLESCGFQVTLAGDGLEGLRLAQENPFDAILTDVEMPGMDGFTLTERLRQNARYRDKPIIILTSRAKDEDKRRGMQVGADAYLVKGDFSQGNLVETLRSLLGWRGRE